MRDILDEMTKAEIIYWIRRKHWHDRPRRSEVLLARWEHQRDQLRTDYQQELDRFARKKPDFAEHDKLAERFNASTDLIEKMDLLRKMKPYTDALKNHISRCKILDERQRKLDRLYKRLDAEQAKELAQ